MKSLKRTFGTTALAGACLLVGCATHPATKVTTTAVVEPTSQPAIVRPIFADAPTTQASPQNASTLPPGHPAVAPQTGGLPAGHPGVDPAAGQSQSGALPAGHPSVGSPAAAAQSGALPPGHPSVNSMGPTAPASTQPVIAGTLNIHAVQNTPGGPAIGAEAVSIDLVSSTTGQLVSHSDSHLNSDGTLDIKGFDVRAGVQAVVTINHGGIAFSAGSELLDADHTTQKLDVPLFETTEQTPAWSITMRHVIIQPSKAGLDVMEMFSINSKGDRAWIGKADAKGNRTTFSVALPAGIQDLKIGGSLDTSSVSVADGKLISKQPIVPGDDRYEIEYTIPAANDKAVLSVTAPASVGNMLVLVPDDGTTIDAAGLQAMGAQQLDEKGPKTRCYMANGLTEGQIVTLTVSGLNSSTAATRPVASASNQDMPDSTPTAAAADGTGSSSMMSKAIAVGGAVTILLVGTLITLLKSPKAARTGKKA